MKFLVITKEKDAILSLSPAAGRHLLEATIAYMAQEKKAGRVLEMNFIPGWNRWAVIGEHKNAEDMMKALHLMPFAAYEDFEVYPLADGGEAMNMLLERFKTAEKMMAGMSK